MKDIFLTPLAISHPGLSANFLSKTSKNLKKTNFFVFQKKKIGAAAAAAIAAAAATTAAATMAAPAAATAATTAADANFCERVRLPPRCQNSCWLERNNDYKR